MLGQLCGLVEHSMRHLRCFWIIKSLADQSRFQIARLAPPKPSSSRKIFSCLWRRKGYRGRL
jgi:hypothetical protein